MSRIHASYYVRCPFSAAVELAQIVAGRRDGFYLTPSPPLGERVRFTVRSTDDATDETRKHDALLIAWRPQNPDLFPDFRGVLTVRPKLRGVLLHLDGQYDPPYGIPGKLFDALFGRVVAHHTMRRLLADLAAEIESEYRQEVRRNQPA